MKLAPEWLASTDGLTPNDRAEEIGRARTALLAMLAGAVATAGAIFTARSYALSRQGQITERFTRAVEQLGHQATDVRVGGIYALERIARDSPRDHGPVVEVLTAYAREHATEHAAHREPGSHVPGAFGGPSTDVQAALTVLGRRTVANDTLAWRLNLAFVQLAGADLRSARLGGADRRTGAYLYGADLGQSDLRWVDARNANLCSTNLQQAYLSLAHLEGAELHGADLTGAHLDDTHLEGATYNAQTVWPDDVDPAARGAILVEA